jgi:hypothetical protein
VVGIGIAVFDDGVPEQGTDAQVVEYDKLVLEPNVEHTNCAINTEYTPVVGQTHVNCD